MRPAIEISATGFGEEDEEEGSNVLADTLQDDDPALIERIT